MQVEKNIAVESGVGPPQSRSFASGGAKNKKDGVQTVPTKINTFRHLSHRLGLAQARDAVSILPLTALLQDLHPFETLQHVALSSERARSS